jgi:hypothetical protein
LCFFKRRKISHRGNTKFLNYGYSDGFFSLKGEADEKNSNIHGGFGADADKFTLAGNKLTFIAKAFEAGSDNTYRVKIKATVDVTIFFVRFPFETEKTIKK